MASSFIANAHQVNFESVLVIPDNEGMLNMFKALEASGLRGFLGCQSVLYEKEEEQFFDTKLVQDGDITGAVSGKFFSISQSRFAQVFDLPTEGLVDFSEVPKNLVYDARSIFSKSGVPVSTHGKKRFMKYEYRLLNYILAKAITMKVGSFDAVTNERFLMMTTIKFGLKSNPVITFGEAVPFPTLKVLSIKTVHTYIAMNHTIDARGQYDEPGMAPVAIVKRKSKSKKTSETTGETPVEVITEVVSKKRPSVESDEPVVPKKRRTTKSKASSSKASLDTVNVAQDVVALQIDSDDENVEEQESVKDTIAVAVEESTVVKHNDEVDVIIGQVLEETSKLATDEAEQREQHLDEPEVGDTDFGDSPVNNADNFEQWLDESFEDFIETETVDKTEDNKEVAVAKTPEKAVGSNQTDEELILGSSIEINELRDSDWYYASFPRISTHDKGKEPLEEDEPVKGNPAREMVELICGDVEFLVQLRDQDGRASGDTALSSPWWDLLAAMCRVVNYHSSWARQQQVELFDASGIRGTQVSQLVVGLTQLEVPQEVMPPRRRGRGMGKFEESAGQNEDRSSARSHTRVSDEEEVEVAAPPVERMDVVIAWFQRMMLE
ncbi:hypothetical protein F511_08059 [Dorcoceras hygrometricum]|uniref:Dystroglycan-like n=1 Tax=Dorcoceras hygrometricum TaxID=472368 RepID=A0A2Z7D543_9LAMI|nr:hypothetical protein F511_08059 [Dorcoceras hygrometricum]